MIELNIPGMGVIELEHLVMDVNGTIAIDGVLIEGIAQKIITLQNSLHVHLLTANTHGKQDLIDETLGIRSIRLRSGNEKEQKANYIEQLGKEGVVAIGQGMNDALMLEKAKLGICVISQEGTAKMSMLAADLILPDINAALELFVNPLRLIASLRQ